MSLASLEASSLVCLFNKAPNRILKGELIRTFLTSCVRISFGLSLFRHVLAGLLHHLVQILRVLLLLLGVFRRFLFMQLVVVVDVHDEEEETTGQDDGATHEEKVLVVVEDVHQQPWEEEKWAFTCVYQNQPVVQHDRQNPALLVQKHQSSAKLRFDFGTSGSGGEIDHRPSREEPFWK